MQLKAFAIDDDIDMLGIYEETIKKISGFSLKTFEGPIDAIQVMKETSDIPDIFILDLRMASMSGVDFLKYLKAVDLMRPTILVSGWIDKQAAINIANAGAHSLLEKPFDEKKFIEAIEHAAADSKIETLHRSIVSMQSQCCQALKAMKGVRSKRLDNIEKRVFSACGKMYGNPLETKKFLDTIAEEKSLHTKVEELERFMEQYQEQLNALVEKRN